MISRTGWTAELGYEIYLRDASRGEELWNRILEAGEPFNIKPTGPSDTRRMEAGIFNWGPDFNWRHNPFEVTGLERLVEEQEADYLGKEPLERVRREGPKRKLVGVEIGESEMPEEMEEFWPGARTPRAPSRTRTSRERSEGVPGSHGRSPRPAQRFPIGT